VSDVKEGMRMVAPGLWVADRCTSIFCPHDPKCADRESTERADFEARIRADEREACAQWFENDAQPTHFSADEVAAAIRARKP
jgi:hypothetical protein